MVRFESIKSGKELGTVELRDGKLVSSTPSIQQIVEGTRRVYRLTDAEAYKYYADGNFDNGYIRAVPA